MAHDLTERLSGRPIPSKGVRIKADDDRITINLSLVVEWGVKIPEIAARVQSAVKEAVESMAEIEIAAVDIHIEGVAFPEGR